MAAVLLFMVYEEPCLKSLPGIVIWGLNFALPELSSEPDPQVALELVVIIFPEQV